MLQRSTGGDLAAILLSCALTRNKLVAAVGGLLLSWTDRRLNRPDLALRADRGRERKMVMQERIIGTV